MRNPDCTAMTAAELQEAYDRACVQLQEIIDEMVRRKA